MYLNIIHLSVFYLMVSRKSNLDEGLITSLIILAAAAFLSFFSKVTSDSKRNEIMKRAHCALLENYDKNVASLRAK